MDSKKSLSRIGTATIVLLVLIGMAVPLGAGAGEKEPNEPNDAQGAATPITGDSIDGEISVSGGTDWFAKEYTKGDEISIVITKKLKHYGLKLSLHAPNGTELDNTTARQGVDIAQLTAKASEPGEYAVKIQGIDDEKMGMGYVVHTSYHGKIEVTDTEFSDGTAHETEPNDEVSNATYVNKSHISGEMSDIEDDKRDGFAFQVRKGEKISILVEMDNPEHRIYLFQLTTIDRYGDRSRAIEEEIDYGDERGQVVAQAKRNGTFIVTLLGNQKPDIEDLPHTYSVKIKSYGVHPLPSEDSTSTPTQTATSETESKSPEMTSQQTESKNTSTTEDSQNDTSTDSDATELFGPGFTGPTAILALLLTGLFGWRRS